MRRLGRGLSVILMAATAAMAIAACHQTVKMPPLPVRYITSSDKFFDVWPTGPASAFVVGARGKVLHTTDGGLTWKKIDIGTSLGVFAIQMVNDKDGYLCGQDGLVMRTEDGGQTWHRLNSRTHLFIFALSFPDRLHGFLVGDQSLVLSTTDGGETFFKRQLEKIFPPALHDYALPYMAPTYYGVKFLNDNVGWVVGEFGRIWFTNNGGKSWTAQQDSLVPQWKRPLGPEDYAALRDFLLPTMFGVDFRDAGHGAACGLEGWVIKTGDGGKSWRFVEQARKPGAPPETRVPGVYQIPAPDPLFSIDLFGGNQGMATGLTGTVLRLQPNGSWARDPNVPALPVPLSQVRFYDPMHGWIVGYGTVLYTADGGKTWRTCQG